MSAEIERVSKKRLEQVIAAEKAAFERRKSRKVPRHVVHEMAMRAARRLLGDDGIAGAMKRLSAK